MKIWLLIIGLVLTLLPHVYANGMAEAKAGSHSSQSLVVGDQQVAVGSKADITLEIAAGDKDGATFIPVTVVRGKHPGPVLAAVAGVHGYEYTSILAVEKWLKTLNPENMHGSVIVVRVAHVPAFENRSVYVNPHDRKNLNRSFPGKANGSQTERIAWAISQQVVAKADFLIDLHSGDGGEWLAPFIGVYGGPLSSDYPQALAVAEAFNFPNVVRYKMNTQKQVDTRRSLNRQGVAAKIPTILVEIGEHGTATPAQVKAMIAGLSATLNVMGIDKTKPNSRTSKSLRYFDNTKSVPVNHAGLWFPTHAKGRFIEKGEVLGVLKDYFGNELEQVKAPVSGYGIYGLKGPAIRKGDSVMTIAVPTNSIK